jgi:hypothetical protein
VTASPPANPRAVFLSGSIMRHVVIMTLTGALGLMSMFVVDLADLYFLNLLNNTEITAAIGYAGIISFANLSVSLGIGIAAAALWPAIWGQDSQNGPAPSPVQPWCSH